MSFETEDFPTEETPRSTSLDVEQFFGDAYRANLYVFDPGGAIHWYVLKSDSFIHGRVFTIGRADDSNIVLSDSSVSNHHAYITFEDGELLLRDLDSTNGTEANDEAVREVALRHGDAIKIGVTYIRFLFSYRDAPTRLILEFLAGPNAAKAITAYSASLTIGRIDCAVCLQGSRVAPQHLRLDAFGPELVFVVNLHPTNETWLNGAAVVGIAPAREGDVLRIGEHEVRLRVTDDPDVLDAIPTGEGTLQIAESVQPRASARAGEMPALQSAQIAAARPATPTDGMAWVDPEWVDGPQTMMEVDASGEAFHSPPPRRDRPTSDQMPAQSPLELPAPLAVLESRSRRKVLATPKRRRGRRRGLGAIVSSILLGAIPTILIGLYFVRVPRTINLDGVVTPGTVTSVTAPTRGRIEVLHFESDARVKAGSRLALLIDLDAEQALEALRDRVKALEDEAAKPISTSTHRRRPEISGASPRDLERAGADLERKRARTQELLAAFNRREISLGELDGARSDEARARAHLDALERKPQHRRSDSREDDNRAEADAKRKKVIDELARLLVRREEIQQRLRVPMITRESGLLERVGELAKGQTVESGQVLFRVAGVDVVRARMAVPGSLLGLVEHQQEIELVPEGFPDRRIRVRLGEPAPAAADDGTFPVEAVFSNGEGRVRPGQRVTAQLDQTPVGFYSWVWSLVTGK